MSDRRVSSASSSKQIDGSMLIPVTAKGGFVMLKTCHDYDEKVNTREKLRLWMEDRSNGVGGVSANRSEAGHSLSGSQFHLAL